MLITYILFGVVPLLLSAWLGLALTQESNRRMTNEELRKWEENIDSELRRCIATYENIAAVVAEDASVIACMAQGGDLDAGAIRLLDTLRLGHDDVMQLHLLSQDNRLRYSSGGIPNLYAMPVYRDYGVFAKAKRSPSGFAIKATKMVTYRGREVVLSLCHTVVDAQQSVLGFVVIDLYRGELDALVRKLEPLEAVDTLLVDDQRIVAYAKRQPQLEGEELKDPGFLVLLSPGTTQAETQIRDERFLAHTVEGLGLTALLQVSQRMIGRLSRVTLQVTGLISVLSALLAVVSAVLLSRRISRQIKRLTDVFEHTKKAEFQSQFESKDGDFAEIEVLGTRYNELTEQIKQLLSNVVEKQRCLVIAEIKALESQMKPHFLYNVLNDIKSLSKLGRNEEVSELAVSFGRLLRASLASNEEFTTIEEDVELVRDYVHMQNIRYDQTIHFRQELQAEILPLVIPRFVLQPIVENAIIHGLAQKQWRHIVFKGRLCDDTVIFEIVDNGVGFQENPRKVPQAGTTLHEGVGLENIRQRLALYYGDACCLSIRSRAGCYTRVQVCFAVKHPLQS